MFKSGICLPVLTFSKNQLLFLWMGILFFPILTFLHARYGLVWTTHEIPTSAMQPYGGAANSFAVAVKLNTGTWMNQTPVFDSPAIVVENFVPLEHGNAGLNSIALRGEGRYTLFKEQLIFSASDNSDPRTNGLRYELSWPMPISDTLAGLQYFCATIGTGLILVAYLRIGGHFRMAHYERSPFVRGVVLSAIWAVILFREGWPISGKFNGVLSAGGLFLAILLLMRSEDRLHRLIRYPLILMLFALPLFGLWKTARFEYHGVVGLFPWSDAQGYYSDALKLGLGIPLSSFSSRRPLFVSLAAVLLQATHRNLQMSLLILCVLNATAAFLLSQRIKHAFGAVLSASVLLLVFYDYSGYGFVGKLLTENLGLCLGVLGLLLLISGAQRNSPRLLGFGCFILSFALNVRAGAFFSLVGVAIWSLFTYWRATPRSLKAFFAVVAGIAAGFICNLLVLKMLGGPDAVAFANFGSTLYGVASGYKHWTYVYDLYPSRTESEYFGLAIELIKHEPGMLLVGILKAVENYLKPETLFQFLYFYPHADQLAASWALYAVSIASLAYLIMNRKDRIATLMLFLLAGIFASVPFTPPIDDGIRAMTATIPISIVGHAFILKEAGWRSGVEQPSDRHDLYAGTLAAAIVLVTVVGGPILRYLAKPVAPAITLTCHPGWQPVAMQLAPGSYVSVVENDQIPYSFLPLMREVDFAQALGANHLFPDLNSVLRDMQAGDSLLVGIDLAESTNIFVITRTDAIQNPSGMNAFCVQSTGYLNFFTDSSVEHR